MRGPIRISNGSAADRAGRKIANGGPSLFQVSHPGKRELIRVGTFPQQNRRATRRSALTSCIIALSLETRGRPRDRYAPEVGSPADGDTIISRTQPTNEKSAERLVATACVAIRGIVAPRAWSEQRCRAFACWAKLGAGRYGAGFNSLLFFRVAVSPGAHERLPLRAGDAIDGAREAA